MSPHLLSSRNIKQINYQILVVVHKETSTHAVFSNILQMYDPAIFYCHSPTVFSQYKTNKLSNTGSCTQGNEYPRCFLQYFTNVWSRNILLSPHLLSSCNIQHIKYQKVVVVVDKETWGHDVSSNILQIYDPAIFYCHLTQYKTNKLSNTGSCTLTYIGGH